MQGFSNSAILAFEIDNSLLWDCPLHCRTFGSLPGFYPSDASSTSIQLWQLKISLNAAQWPLAGTITLVENYCFNEQLFTLESCHPSWVCVRVWEPIYLSNANGELGICPWNGRLTSCGSSEEGKKFHYASEEHLKSFIDLLQHGDMRGGSN